MESQRKKYSSFLANITREFKEKENEPHFANEKKNLKKSKLKKQNEIEGRGW